MPQAAVERELLDILSQYFLAPAMTEKLLSQVNTELRARAATTGPRLAEIRKTLTQVEREITNYTKAIGRGDFVLLDTALSAAEQRRTALHAELAALDGHRPVDKEITLATLERHLERITDKLRSGVSGKVREGIQQLVKRIVVEVDGA